MFYHKLFTYVVNQEMYINKICFFIYYYVMHGYGTYMFLVIKTSVLYFPCNVLKLADVACLTCTHNLEEWDPIVLWLLKHSYADSKSGCIYFIHLLKSHNQLKCEVFVHWNSAFVLYFYAWLTASIIVCL